MGSRPRFALSGDPPRPIYRGLRRINPLEQQVQTGALELLHRLPHEVSWAHKVPAGQFVALRRDPASGLSARQQLDAAAAAGYFKKSQIAYIVCAPEGVLDLGLGLVGLGVHCELEIKQPGKRPTQAQQERIELVRSNGGLADWRDDIGEIQPLIRAWRKQAGRAA